MQRAGAKIGSRSSLVISEISLFLRIQKASGYKSPVAEIIGRIFEFFARENYIKPR